MSGKSSKKLRRAIRKEKEKIKIEGLDEFMAYASSQRLRNRIVFALRIVFKRVNINDNK
jgi:hypothetical protein